MSEVTSCVNWTHVERNEQIASSSPADGAICCSRSEILEALSFFQSIPQARVRELSEYVLCSVGEGVLLMKFVGNESIRAAMAIACEVGVCIARGSEFLLPVKRLRDSLKNISSDTVTMEPGEADVLVRATGMRVNLRTPGVDKYGAGAMADSAVALLQQLKRSGFSSMHLEVDATLFRKGIDAALQIPKAVNETVDVDSVCFSFDSAAKTLDVVGCDSSKMTVMRIPATVIDFHSTSESTGSQAMLTGVCAKAVHKACTQVDSTTIEILISETVVAVFVPRSTVVAQTCKGKFFPFRRMIDKTSKLRVVFNVLAKELKRGLEASKSMLDENAVGITFKKTEHIATITTGLSDHGKAQVDLIVSGDGEIETTLNAFSLQGLIATIKPDDMIYWKQNSGDDMVNLSVESLPLQMVMAPMATS